MADLTITVDGAPVPVYLASTNGDLALAAAERAETAADTAEAALASIIADPEVGELGTTAVINAGDDIVIYRAGTPLLFNGIIPRISVTGSITFGNSNDTPSDNSVVIAGQNYSDAAPLTDAIHTFCTVGTASFTAAGHAGNDYDTARIYTGTGVWQHHIHFQTGTVFEGDVQFTDVVGLSGTITVRDNANITNYYYVEFFEAAPEDAAVVGRNVMLRYNNSHFASDMTNITSATQNYALEVRKFLLDPATAYSASVYTEGQATFKAISAGDSEVSPYDTDGTLNTNLDRYNCRSSAGQDGFFRFTNPSNAWKMGQVADATSFRIRSVAGPNGGIDIEYTGHVTPTAADNTADLGTAAISWRGVHAKTGFYFNGTKVVGAQGAAVADATGAGDVVAQLNALLARLRAHGLIAT